MKQEKTEANNKTEQAIKRATKLESQVQSLNDEIIELRSQVFKLRDELHMLRNSRVVGRIIKTRDAIGNPYTLPKRAANKTRRVVAEFVPDSVRLPLMKKLRGVRDTVRSRINTYKDGAVRVTIVENQPWTKDTPLVSVVIPYYNRADTIDETLESLAAQTFRNFETIIVNDHSSDDESIKKLKSLQGVQVIHHETNQGVAAARNNGIAKAKGKYVICLDSDDMLDPTFIEKATVTLELNPDIALVTTYQDMFGVVNELFEKHPYDPMRLIFDNMVITAAQFRREAWEKSGGYKPSIGYEDWDFWLTLSENGFWGKLIPEALFKYRTSMQSRYVEDKDVHWNNLKKIRSLHPKYKSTVRALLAKRQFVKRVVDPSTALVNLQGDHYLKVENKKPNVLITVPWLDFGGVSTLLHNFTREVQGDVNLHIITGLHNKNEWDYKFKEVSPYVYHMPNMFDESYELQLAFMSHYIETRSIDVLHLVHNGFVFDMLPELKKRHPGLKVIVTVFNDRAPYLDQSVQSQEYIDVFTTDNDAVGKIFHSRLTVDSPVKVIPNGINIDMEFNPDLINREKSREELKLNEDELAVFFIGRLSEEKNPDVFVNVAKAVAEHSSNTKKIEFFIIGDGPMRKGIEAEIVKHKIPRVTYLGYQSDVAKYLAAADVFILPSAAEGFPLSVLEAMAMRTAVIASRVGAVPDVIRNGKNGYIVEPGSVKDIESAIAKLFNAETRASIQQSARKDVEEKYSNKKLGDNYRTLYEEVQK